MKFWFEPYGQPGRTGIAAQMSGRVRPVTLESELLAYATELDEMPDTGLIGPAAVASRIRALVQQVGER